MNFFHNWGKQFHTEAPFRTEVKENNTVISVSYK